MPRITRLPRDACRAASFLAALIVAAGLTIVANPVYAEEPARPTEDALARTRATVLIESLLKEREKIVSAIVHVQGGIAFARDALPPERTIRGTYAFDHSKGALRFDSSRQMRIRAITPAVRAAAGNDLQAAMALAEEKAVDARAIYLRTRDLTASWFKSDSNSRTQVCLGPPGGGAGGFASIHFLMDLRACGLMSQFDLNKGGFDVGTGVKNYCDNLLKLAVDSVTEMDGLAVVALRSKYGEHRLTIDTAHQFTPLEYHVSWKQGPGNSSDGSTTSRVKWTEVNGVRVPKSFSIEFIWPDENAYSFSHFVCLWKSVNQPIDKSYFDYKAFPDIPDRTDVVDSRGKGNAALVGFWTAEGIVGPDDDSEDGPSGIDPTQPQPGDAKNEQTLIEGTQAGQERDDNGLKMIFVWCPPGNFVMGSPPGEPECFETEDQVEVVLTRGFWIGKYEVTQGNWAQFKTPLLWKGREGVREGDEFPAMYLSWENAMAFCRRLTREERAAGRLPPGWQYTLPTEAQWEYACRAGTTTRFSFGVDELLLGDHAWYRNNAAVDNQRYAHAVGEKKPNQWGIHDMHGNVSEWCRDGWQKKLPGGTDPFVPPKDDLRAVRGGHFHFPGVCCKSAFRDAERARDRSNMLGGPGLRVVLCQAEKE